jgi:cellobiose-specific phosphotransferase system component IIC
MSTQNTAQAQSRDFFLDTYRYLRGGMAVMIVMLGASVIGERLTATCWQGSISAYYYTSAHAVFIAALCAIGAQLIVYKGSTDTEDALLDLAGTLAFVVALVPTQLPERLCGQSQPAVKSPLAVTNNIWAVIIALATAQVVSWWLYRRAGGHHRSLLGEITVWALRLVIGVGLVGFIFFRDLFYDNAHGVAAAIMFIAIIITVVITAFLVSKQQSPHKGAYQRAYQIVAGLMGLTLLLVIAVHLAWGWNHWVIALESALILEFAAYWVIQTVELWQAPNRIELIPEEMQPQMAKRRDKGGPAGLVKDIREMAQYPKDERLMRAL